MLGQIQLREEIAERLKQARQNSGFASVEDFCKSTGLPIAEYLNHETGRTALKASQAMQYCRLLHITLHWLMFGQDIIKPTERKKRHPPTLRKTEPDS
ncbi:MAG TPA: hypothetical protein VHE99_02640 [Gammaproteobacteria bacterium]|nr:hypothetical protein [Gammaproteobacteria bacterium]